MEIQDEVDYVSGRTRVFGIVGHPIAQVRSPEMFTAEFRRRGVDAILVPLHVLPEDFDAAHAAALAAAEPGGLVFTIPYKVRACALAESWASRRRSWARSTRWPEAADGRWRADIFDGLGCVEAFRRRSDIPFAGKRVMLLGAGGAGSAIAVAIGCERPASLRIYDVDAERAAALARKVAHANPGVDVTAGAADGGRTSTSCSTPRRSACSATRGCRSRSRRLPRELVVFDAIVKPERTPLLALAETCGCTTVYGREMMRGQISRMVDFFLA